MEVRILQQNEDITDKLFESEECQTLLEIYKDYYPKMGFKIPWVAYLLIEQNQVLGSCGFVGQPQDDKVEIAYWTFKEFEGQGVASFACKALVSIAHTTDPKVIVTAKTAPENNASTRILEKHNFVFSEIVQDEEIGDAWLWKLQPRTN
ncbi:MAG: hypothetical protein CFE21_09450 [Bacteroidetes bacterium B1(2017)]|nr:MAG: hypothetical protein CFE21_09450 [Bacteroidetes bacterium B1(2017)]